MNESTPDGYTTLGTYVHELGHSAFGLRDQYHSPRNIGKWGLMGGGVNRGDPPGSQPVHMLGASKVMAGFIEPTVVLPQSTGRTFALPPHQSRWYDVIKIPTAVQEYYYILENRRAEGTYDSALLSEWPPLPDHGLLISLVDGTGRNFIQDADLNINSNGYQDLNLFSLEGNHTFGPDTQPASRTPAEADGFAREATGLRVNLEREEGDSLVVSVALGREFVCQEYTSTNPVHVDNDRAYTGQVRGDSGWEEKYYAAGSEDDLGLSRTQLVTLIEGQSGDYSLGSCGPPVVEEVYPPRLDQLVLLPNELIWPRELNRAVQFSADVSDPEKDIARVDFRLDNGPWQAGHAELEWEGDWGEGEVVRFYYNVPPADVPAGSHEVQVRAFDVEGHMSDITSYAFQIEP